MALGALAVLIIFLNKRVPGVDMIFLEAAALLVGVASPCPGVWLHAHLSPPSTCTHVAKLQLVQHVLARK